MTDKECAGGGFKAKPKFKVGDEVSYSYGITYRHGRIIEVRYDSKAERYEYYICGHLPACYGSDVKDTQYTWKKEEELMPKNIEKLEPDNVNHPSHYETGKFECIEVMEEALGREAVRNFCLCNAFKYIYRHKRKNGDEDIKKAQWYINKYLELSDELGKTKEEIFEEVVTKAHANNLTCSEDSSIPQPKFKVGEHVSIDNMGYFDKQGVILSYEFNKEENVFLYKVNGQYDELEVPEHKLKPLF